MTLIVEEQLELVLVGASTELEKAQRTAEFWKHNFMKLHHEYDQLVKEFAEYQEVDLDDGK